MEIANKMLLQGVREPMIELLEIIILKKNFTPTRGFSYKSAFYVHESLTCSLNALNILRYMNGRFHTAEIIPIF